MYMLNSHLTLITVSRLINLFRNNWKIEFNEMYDGYFSDLAFTFSLPLGRMLIDIFHNYWSIIINHFIIFRIFPFVPITTMCIRRVWQVSRDTAMAIDPALNPLRERWPFKTFNNPYLTSRLNKKIKIEEVVISWLKKNVFVFNNLILL